MAESTPARILRAATHEFDEAITDGEEADGARRRAGKIVRREELALLRAAAEAGDQEAAGILEDEAAYTTSLRWAFSGLKDWLERLDDPLTHDLDRLLLEFIAIYGWHQHTRAALDLRISGVINRLDPIRPKPDGPRLDTHSRPRPSRTPCDTNGTNVTCRPG